VVLDSDTEHDSGDDEVSDWLSEVEDEEFLKALIFRDELLDALSTELADIFEDDVSGDSVVAALIKEALSAGSCIKLYDSGSTEHLSPYRDLFTSYCEIFPQPFTAANQQSFDMTGTGNMVIEVPDSCYGISILNYITCAYLYCLQLLLVTLDSAFIS
jgi:hypothetical protein